MSTRSCGPCSECCTVLGVHELSKAPFVRCRHVEASKGGCCGIHRNRPVSCSEFSCLWLGGHFDRKDRPDRTGIVLATGEMQWGQVVFAYVRKPGADASGRGAELLRTLAERVPVCVTRWNGKRSVLVPEELRGALPRIIREFTETQAIVGDDGRVHRLPLLP